MRRRIGKVLAILVLAMSIFLCVCCTASEDALSSDMDVKEEAVEETTVSEDEMSIPLSEDQMETEIEEIPEKTDDSGMPETVEEVDKPVENSEDKNLIYYVCDEKVWENELFCAFLEGEMTAYDRHQEEHLTWSEYFRQEMEDNHGFLQGMQLAAEDLDGDGKEELMVLLDDSGEAADLYVFHEEEEKLYAWDRIENFYALQGGKVSLGKNGIFYDIWASTGRIFKECAWSFNGNGEQEFIWYLDVESGHSVEEYGKEYEYTINIDHKYTWSRESLYIYEDGECVRELSRVWQKLERQDWSEAELVESDGEFDEVYSTLCDALPETIEYFSLPKWADDAAKIPIWEVPGGQGWVSVENPPEYLREFEYSGEDGNAEGNKAEDTGE